MLDRFIWAARFALIRLVAQWRSSLTMLVGVLLAAAIGAFAPLYTAAVSQVGMIERLNQTAPENIQLYNRITYRDAPTLANTWAGYDQQYRAMVKQHFSFPDWVQQVINGVESSPMPIYRDETLVEGYRLRLAWYEDWQNRVELIEGTDTGAVIGIDAANLLGVRVGDVVTLQNPAWNNSEPVSVEISGLVQERNPTDLYWIYPGALRIDRTRTSSGEIEMNVLLARDEFIRIIEEALPDASVQINWRVLFDYENLPFAQSEQAVQALGAFQSAVEEYFEPAGTASVSLVHRIDTAPILNDYREEVRLIRAPVNLLILQMGALVLLFLMVIVSLVRQGERRELALLQSRGAHDWHIYMLRGVETLVICVSGTLLAPYVARQVLIWLTPLFTEVDRLPLAVTTETFAFAGMAAVATFIMLLLTLRPVLQMPLISAGGSTLRSDTQVWWQRYYLDVLLMVIGIIGLWRLLNTNSALIETGSGQNRADPLLLLTPTVLFLALGSLLLRLFPILMSLIARLFSRLRGLGGVLAAWQVSREPMHYARITFLLALAIGVGWFATSFQATIIRSQSDQARYKVGTDLRLVEEPRLRPLEDYLAVPGVDSAVIALRYADMSVDISGLSLGGGDVLITDTNALRDLAFWRDDLGKMPVLAPAEEVPPETGFQLPADTQTIQFWVYAYTIQPMGGTVIEGPNPVWLLLNASFHLRLRDSAGNSFELPLGWQEFGGIGAIPWDEEPEFEDLLATVSASDGWGKLEGHFEALGENPPQGEVWVEGIAFESRDARFTGISAANLVFDDFTAIDSAGVVTELPWFTQPEAWTLTSLLPPLTVELAYDTAPGREEPTLQAAWDRFQQITNFGLRLNYPAEEGIPALVSRSFLELNNLQEGMSFTLPLGGTRVLFTITDSIDYYPTLYAQERPFIVADLDRFLYNFNRQSPTPTTPNEVWLRLKPGVTEAEVIQTLESQASGTFIVEQQTFSTSLNQLETDPISVGLLGLLLISFLVVLTLSVISLLIYLTLNMQVRRAEYGVLRALGVSSSRLIASLAFELMLIMTAAIVLGVIMGVFLSDQVLPTLASTTTTTTVAPPFLVRIESEALLQYVGLLGVVLFGVLSISIGLVRRLSLSQMLRLNEE